MATIASAVIAGLVFLRDTAKLCYSFKKIYHEKRDSLTEKAETLRSRKVDVERRAEEAIQRDEIIKEVVKDWLTRTDKLLVDYERRTKTPSWINLCGRFEAVENVEKLASRLKEVLSEPMSFDRVSDPRPPPPAAPSELKRITFVEGFTEFSSTETALEKVKRALEDTKVRVIGVHGIPGVGKTVMVNRAVSIAMQEGLFDHLLLLTVSRSPNFENILKKAAEHLGLTLSADQSAEMWASIVKSKIKREKKVLIVLDDVWEEFSLGRAGLPSGIELAEFDSKIVLTTRHENVCHRMRCQEKIYLDICSLEESRCFFKLIANTEFDSARFEKTAESVADECRGLPLALVAVAKALGDKPEKEWESALDRLRRSRPPNPDFDGTVFECVKLSYDFLKFEQKDCFLMCCLFPEDHNIATEDLTRYGFGLGWFPHASTVDQARRETETIVQKLKASGLLLAANNQKVKMHDVIRDVAIQITSSDLQHSDEKEKEKDNEDRPVFLVQTRNHEPQEWPLRKSYKLYTAISAVSNVIRELNGSPDCTRLRALLLQYNKNLCHISFSFFHNMKSLELLDLSGTEVSYLPMPNSASETMRVLHLDRCKFEKFSKPESMKNLVILSLRDSDIDELPSCVKDLPDLRILDLTMTPKIKRILPNVLSGLRHLEELYMKGSFADWHDSIDEETVGNASFAELANLRRLKVLEVDIARAKCLREVRVESAPDWAKFDICICSDKTTRQRNVNSSTWTSRCSRNLLLDSPLEDLPSWFFDAVSRKTEELNYAGSKKVDLIREQSGGRLAKLKFVTFEKFTWVTHFIQIEEDQDQALFESLRELQIHDSSIRHICDRELPEGSLKNLEFVMVQSSHEMENSVIPLVLMKRLRSLKRLHVRSANPTEVFASHGTPQSPQQQYLDRLSEIRLISLYKLDKIWKGPTCFANFGSLERVSVIQCDKLRHVLSVSILGSLVRLEDLWVEECIMMVELFGVEEEIVLESTFTLQSLKSLCVLKLPKLRNIHADSCVLKCPNLEYLHVQDCPLYHIHTSELHSSKEVLRNDGQHIKTLKKRMTPMYY